MALIKHDLLNNTGWHTTFISIKPIRWMCGYCGGDVAANMAFVACVEGGQVGDKSSHMAYTVICPNCSCPTFYLANGEYFPNKPPGEFVAHVPSNLEDLYNEARQSSGAGAHTGAVMICRKILMHIGVDKGAKPGQSFMHYVEYLDSSGYIPPDGKAWVDYIRTTANEANHEIVIMSQDDAMRLITFVEMLLRFIYEFPNSIPSSSP